MKVNSINSQYVNTYRTKNNTAPSFKGFPPESVTSGLSNFYTNVAKKDFFQKFIKNFSKSDRTFTHVLVAESCFLSGFYMINTLRNKKIKKEQKPQMVINDALTLGVSTAGAYLVEDKINKFVSTGAKKYISNRPEVYRELGLKAQQELLQRTSSTPKLDLLNKVAEVASRTGEELAKGADDVAKMFSEHISPIVSKEANSALFQITPDKFEAVKTSLTDAIKTSGSAEKAKETVLNLVDDVYNTSASRSVVENTIKGFNKLKTLVILGLIYRFLGPVVITPIANKLSSKFFNKKTQNTEQKK